MVAMTPIIHIRRNNKFGYFGMGTINMRQAGTKQLWLLPEAMGSILSSIIKIRPR